MRRLFALAALLMMGIAPGVLAQEASAEPGMPVQTTVKDKAALARLLGNEGLSLQWIGWDKRGTIKADFSAPLLRLTGSQTGETAGAKLKVDGVVTEIGADYFWFTGRIIITGAPDAKRYCERDGEMTFRITQNRKYWRLQEMEVCDGLTDYVDIYF